MGLAMAHEDPTGVPHPEAYWRVTEVDLDFQERAAQIRLQAFHTLSASRSGKQPVDQAWYYARGDDFDRYFVERNVKDENGKPLDITDPRAAAYAFIKAPILEPVMEPAEIDDRTGEVVRWHKARDKEVPGRFAGASDA